MRGEDGLFEIEPVEAKRRQDRPAAVDRPFGAFDPHQVLLLPPSLDDWLIQDQLARFVTDLVDEVLDLSPLLADYTERRGHPPHDPRLMLRLLIYGYTTGIRSSRAIERKCVEDVAFRFLAADQAPDFRSIARCRRRHLNALADLFTRSLHLAQKPGVVKMGRVAPDGAKLEANAYKHKAMSDGRRRQGGADRGRDRPPGGEGRRPARRCHRHRRGLQVRRRRQDTDLPTELDRREKRLARLQAARAQIEAEAAEKARLHAEDKERRTQQRTCITTTNKPSPTPASRPPTRHARSRRPRPTSLTPTRGS